MWTPVITIGSQYIYIIIATSKQVSLRIKMITLFVVCLNNRFVHTMSHTYSIIFYCDNYKYSVYHT